MLFFLIMIQSGSSRLSARKDAFIYSIYTDFVSEIKWLGSQ